MFDLRFDQQGQGQPVVLLPPFPFDRRIWSVTVPTIVAAGYRAIAVDYPGFGESPPEEFSIADLADATAALLDKLGLERAILMGMSMGGYVALAFAQRFPARLRALILADTRAAGDSDGARQGRAKALETIATRGVDMYLAGALPLQLSPDAPVEVLNAVTRLAAKDPTALATAIAALRDRPDRTTEAPRIACPTLVVVGAADQITPAAEMKTMAQAIPGARFVELPAAGHLSNIQATQAFNRTVADFLGGLAVNTP